MAGTVEYANCTLQRVKNPPPNECPGYDTKPSDAEVPLLDLKEM